MASDGSETLDDEIDDSEDDLEITQAIRKTLKTIEKGSVTAAPAPSDQDSATDHAFSGDENENEGNAAGPASKKRASRPKGEKVAFTSDSESSHGAHVYERFKNRKAIKRKRAAASTRKAKEVENARNPAKKSKVMTEKQKAAATAYATRQAKVNQDIGSDSDDLGMEYTLPGYLQDRRKKFDIKKALLEDAGLKLPPTYDDVVFSDNERIQELSEKPDFPNAKPPAAYKDIQLPHSMGLIPAPIAQWLRDYQVHGVAFLHKMFVYQTGGILGDDMGLGKTVQVIAFLAAAFGKTGDERDAKRMRKKRRREKAWYPKALVVCPGTLIENWKAEFAKWGWWVIDVFHGDSKEGAMTAAKAGRLEIMITTYTTYRLDKDQINMVEWDVVIADECHQIKGRKSETTIAMNDVNALCRVGLTGTAIQNSYDELWTLLNWTNPGVFGPISTWKATISEPLKIGQSHEATVYQLGKARKTAKALVENLLPRFFLRRMKSLIKDQLPKKSDRVVFCPLTETQALAYQRCLASDMVEYIKLSAETCDCGSNLKRGWCCYQEIPEDGGKWQSYVFPAISNLQKLANHLAILIPQGNDPVEKQEKDLRMLKDALPDQWRQLYKNRDSIIHYSNPEFCGKWRILRKLLAFWHASGDKVLVFSHSVRLLKMLKMLFTQTSYNVSYLDGQMAYVDRQTVVDEFNADPAAFVFLISTKAGGVGLNITAANKVVIVDPNWNPSYDLQAQDRAYRIGQTRDVEVFRLVSAGTIEEIVYARQIYKQQQANIGYTASMERRYFKGVQNNKDMKGEIFGLSNLFSYHNDSVVLRDIVNKTNIAETRAGVSVVDVELDNIDEDDDPLLINTDDKQDSVMSQLAALVTGEANKPNTKKPRTAGAKSDPVQAILASAGVEYTHENSEVVGSSRVEAHLSRRAEENQNDLDAGEGRVFPESQLKPANPHPNPRVYTEGDSDVEVMEIPEYKYNPPEEVKRRQFCEMARTFGFEGDVVGFALVVERWTQAQRRGCLDRFYRGRRRRRIREGVI